MRAFAIVIALAGCSLDYTPDVGPILAAPDDGGAVGTVHCNNDSNPDAKVSFSADVRPLMLRSPGGCTCHLGRTTSSFDLGSYTAMRRGGVNSGTQIIIPGQPCQSILLEKLGRTPPFGSRMPFNGPPYFTAEELQLVSDWIAEGALDN